MDNISRYYNAQIKTNTSYHPAHSSGYRLALIYGAASLDDGHIVEERETDSADRHVAADIRPLACPVEKLPQSVGLRKSGELL